MSPPLKKTPTFLFLLKENDYALAIRSVGSVLAPYDSDQKFPAYGFGARFRHNGEVSHCFPLNFNPKDVEVSGIQVSGTTVE